MHTQTNLLGVTNRDEALRFGERAADAPRLDLSDYTLTLEHRRATIAAGNTSFSGQRHIIQSAEGRGITSAVRVGRGT